MDQKIYSSLDVSVKRGDLVEVFSSFLCLAIPWYNFLVPREQETNHFCFSLSLRHFPLAAPNPPLCLLLPSPALVVVSLLSSFPRLTRLLHCRARNSSLSIKSLSLIFHNEAASACAVQVLSPLSLFVPMPSLPFFHFLLRRRSGRSRQCRGVSRTP